MGQYHCRKRTGAAERRSGRGGRSGPEESCVEVRGWRGANVDVVALGKALRRDWQQCCWELAIRPPVCVSDWQPSNHLKLEREGKFSRWTDSYKSDNSAFFSGKSPLPASSVQNKLLVCGAALQSSTPGGWALKWAQKCKQILLPPASFSDSGCSKVPRLRQ